MKKITFLGLGVMGFPMAGHLCKRGFDVNVYNRTKKKAEFWVSKFGGSCSASIGEAVSESDVVISCVGNDEDLYDVTLGDNNAFTNMKPGSIFIDHTTASAEIAVELHDKAKQFDLAFLDAPVSGGEVGAKNGELTIMVGGEKSDFDRVELILNSYSKSSILIGGPGKGQIAKMVNQICIAGLVQALSEAISFSEKTGLDTKKVLAAISQGAAGSWQLSNRGETMVDRKFDFGFAVNLMQKDLGICLNHAKKNNITLPITSLVDQFYTEISIRGGEKFDTSSLIMRFD
ncbi:NAD(P)-dependent oxidoreductase [Paracoccaceae bacterium]|nr:NAD(P)-dependent oxidoreductase [Paracoccaceae bacterium]